MVPSKRLSLVAAGVAALVVGADLANFRVAADAEKPSVEESIRDDNRNPDARIIVDEIEGVGVQMPQPTPEQGWSVPDPTPGPPFDEDEVPFQEVTEPQELANDE